MEPQKKRRRRKSKRVNTPVSSPIIDAQDSQAVTKEDIIRKLSELARLIANSEDIDETIEQHLNSVLSDYQIRFKQFIVAYARTRIGSMTELMRALEDTEKILYSPDCIRKAKTFELLKMQTSITKSMQSIVDLILLAKDVDLPHTPGATNIFVQHNVQHNEITGVVSSKNSRTHIRNAISAVLSNLQSPQEQLTDIIEATDA